MKIPFTLNKTTCLKTGLNKKCMQNKFGSDFIFSLETEKLKKKLAIIDKRQKIEMLKEIGIILWLPRDSRVN